MLILLLVTLGNYFAGSQLVKLRQDRRRSMKAAFAQGTKNNLRVQWKSYLLFCEFFSINAIPASVDSLSLYAQFLSRSFQTVAAIQNYLSGVHTLHLFLGLDCPKASQFEIRMVLTGLKRLNPHRPKQARPITPEILSNIRENLDLSVPSEATFWCAFLFAFFLMLRKSNLVPNKASEFSPVKQLARRDVALGKSSLVVTISWSKTIQFGERALSLPLFALGDHPLCPVAAYASMVYLSPVSKHSAAFVLPNPEGDLIPMTYRQLQAKLKFEVAKLGYEPSQFSSHSFRRGGASWAFEAGIPAELIKLQGDWASDAYLKYLDFSFKSRSKVFAKMSSHFLQV